MMSVRIELCDRLPERAQFDAVLGAYYKTIVERMAAFGVDIEPEAAQSAAAEFWENAAGYLPPNGALAIARGTSAQIVGCGMLKRLDNQTGELKRLFVMDAARGTGAGRRLVEIRIAAARDLGFKRLVADTLVSNVEMRRLYPKLGFVEVGAPLDTTSYRDHPALRPHMLFFAMDLSDR